jgi:hypothetical protein
MNFCVGSDVGLLIPTCKECCKHASSKNIVRFKLSCLWCTSNTSLCGRLQSAMRANSYVIWRGASRDRDAVMDMQTALMAQMSRVARLRLSVSTEHWVTCMRHVSGFRNVSDRATGCYHSWSLCMWTVIQIITCGIRR